MPNITVNMGGITEPVYANKLSDADRTKIIQDGAQLGCALVAKQLCDCMKNRLF
jgi:hypothetical protein